MNSRENFETRPSLWITEICVVSLLVLAVFYMWKPTLGISFYQDDYGFLFLSQNLQLGLIPGTMPWIHDWRPLGLVVPFYLMRRFFGLDPFAFHLTNMLIHLLNAALVYRLAFVMIETRKFALLATIFYSLHLAHTRSMQWAVGIDNFLSVTWYLLAFSLYLQFREHGRRWHYWSSLAAFAIALLTKEWSISLVPVILWYELVCAPDRLRSRRPAQWKPIAIPIAGYCLLLLAYLTVRLSLFTLPGEGQYAFKLSSSLAMSNFARYLGFASFEFSPTPVLAGVFVALFFFVLLLSFTLRWREVAFGLGWFAIALSPVLFISRLEPYFLAIPLVGFTIGFASLAKIAAQRLLFHGIERRAVFLFTSALFVTMLIGGSKKVRAEQEDVWLVTPQRFADCTLAYISSRWPALSSHSLLFFQDFQEEEAYFLGFGSAVNVLYNDNTIRTSFIPQNDTYFPFINVVAKPSSQNEKIVRRDALAAFCAHTPSLRLQ